MTNEDSPAEKHDGNSSSHEPVHPRPQVPDHELMRCIGKGSYGEVWLARSVIGTYRAVKVVFRHDFEHERPYEREFSGMKKFEPISRSHEGLVDILQVGRNDQAGYFYYVMELGDDVTTGQAFNPDRYEAKTLAKEIARRGMLPFAECLQLSLSLTTALNHLHQHELIHRDIKPSNIIFVNGTPKIADIGLVAGVGTSRSYVGTEGYIPPEGPGTAQADIYSLGKVIYEITTGKDRNTYPELPTRLGHIADQKEFVELNEVVVKACDNDLHKRYQSAEEMRGDLLLLLAGKSVKRLRLLERRLAALTRLGILIGVALLLVAGVVFQVNREMKRAAEERQREAGTDVAHGTRAMDEGDWLGSLPWFVKALRLDQDDPSRERTHRLRIASVLQFSPKLEQMWFHSNLVSCVEFSADGKKVLTASTGDGARIWTVNTGEPVSPSFPYLTTDGSDTAKAFFSPNEQFIVTSGADKFVGRWDVLNPGQRTELITHGHPAFSARFDATGKLIVVTEDNHAFICGEQLGQRLGPELAKHTNSVMCAAFSPDGSKIVTASRDSTAIIWDAKTHEPIGEPLRHTSWVYYAAFSPDGRYVATACFDRYVRVWDLETRRELYPPLLHGDGVRCVEFSPDGKLLLSASFDFTARLWNARNGKAATSLLKHSGKVLHASFSPDGRHIATACSDGTVRIWRLETAAKNLEPLQANFSPDGEKFLGVSNNFIQVQDALASNTIASFATSQPLSDAIFSGDGNALLAISTSANAPDTAGFQAQLWNTTNGQPCSPLFPLDNAKNVKALSYRGDMLAIYKRGGLEVLDTRTGKQLNTFPHEGGHAPKVAFDRSGKRIAVISDKKVHLCNLKSEPMLIADLDHPAEVTHAEFSPDGELLVTTCSDASLAECSGQIWSASTGQRIGEPLKHRDGVFHASFSADSKWVVTASEDYTAIIWNARNGRARLNLPLLHGDQVYYAAFSQNGQWVVTASRDGVARVWDTSTGDPVTPPLRHTNSVVFVQFIANDHRILTKLGNGNSCTGNYRKNPNQSKCWN